MSKIYCLISNGSSLSDEICDLLFYGAQEVMSNRSAKKRVSLISIKLKGEITNTRKAAVLGGIAGMVFEASLDWADGSVKTTYIVRPIKNRDEVVDYYWVRRPLFEERLPNPVNN